MLLMRLIQKENTISGQPSILYQCMEMDWMHTILTEEMAIQWCKDSMGEEQVTSLEASIANQIAESKAPSVVAEVPW